MIGHSAPVAADTPVPENRTLFLLSLSLFFIWGFATVLIDILIPKLKGLFALSFAEAMLTQFAFFFGYFVFSLPAGWLVARIGYLRGIIVGLLVMAGGCLMFVPAARMGVYPGFLLALFVMSAGITTLQVSANAVISVVGAADRASSRLTLAQAFNSLGTFIGPFVGAALILDGPAAAPVDITILSPEALTAMRIAGAASVEAPYLGIAATLLVLTAIFFFARNLLPRTPLDAAPAGPGFALLRKPRLAFAVIAIFAYVGAEVSIGSLLINFLERGDVLAATPADAGRLIALYWGGAMVGRFIGAWVLARVQPGVVLAGCAALAIILTGVAAVASGFVAAAAILAIGLCNAVMFPTIFSQGLLGLGDDAPRGSALLCMGIVGGAILPLATGLAADALGLRAALLVPALAYGWVLFFATYVVRDAQRA